MKETGMNHQHINRKERGEGLYIKQILHLTIIFVLCFWLLHQIYHILNHVRRDHEYDDFEIRNQRIGRLFGRKGGLKTPDNADGLELYGVDHDIEKKLRNERIWKVLGRKGGLGFSQNAEGMELYGMDLIGEAERIKHVGEYDEEREAVTSFSEGSDEEHSTNESSNTIANDDDGGLDFRELGQVSAKEGEIKELMQEKNAISSAKNESRTLISKDGIVGGRNKAEVVSLVNLGAVILKRDDKGFEVFRFNDETGPPKHDSAPSRRINIQVGSSIKGRILRMGEASKGIESCQKFSLKNCTEKQRLNKLDRKTDDHEEMTDSSHLTVAESGLSSMRELLQRER